jgi:translation initiation factor IF-3
LPEALQIAGSLGLDLVEVAAGANPPVCRIMDYGKWRYEASQRAKESRRKASHATLKEMKYRPKIGTGDFDTKTKKVEQFLSQGHKVKVTIMFRGREVHHPERGMQILDRVAEAVDHVGKVDQSARLDGRNMTMVLSPDRRAQQSRKRIDDSETPTSGSTDTQTTETQSTDTQSAPVQGVTAAGTPNGSSDGAEPASQPVGDPQG